VQIHKQCFQPVSQISLLKVIHNTAKNNKTHLNTLTHVTTYLGAKNPYNI